MDMETKRVIVDGLRGADVATLQVLTQDVLGLPVNQIHPKTVCDLFALAEVSDQVPDQLARDLAGFVERCQRELGDLPDAVSLDAYSSELKAEDGARVPETMRACLQVISAAGDEDVQAVVAALDAHIAGAAALPFEVSADSSMASEAATSRTAAVKPKKKAASKPKSKADDERRLWIAEFALSRLANYETGLKESLIVGAARHKAPWDDVTDREVRSVLRAMGRDGKLRTTVGRWLINR
jgi:hypothetical protein